MHIQLRMDSLCELFWTQYMDEIKQKKKTIGGVSGGGLNEHVTEGRGPL